MVYFLFGSAFLEGDFINDFDGVFLFIVDVGPFEAFGEPTYIMKH